MNFKVDTNTNRSENNSYIEFQDVYSAIELSLIELVFVHRLLIKFQ